MRLRELLIDPQQPHWEPNFIDMQTLEKHGRSTLRTWCIGALSVKPTILSTWFISAYPETICKHWV